jgi:hypothetical protein
MRSSSYLALLAALVCGGVSCADFHRGHAPGDGGHGSDGSQGADQAFEKLVYPILQRNCADCHSAGPQDPSTNYVLTGNANQDRAMVLALVTPGNPSDSLLLVRATGNAHTGGRRLDVDGADYQTIADWILGLDPVAQAAVQP